MHRPCLQPKSKGVRPLLSTMELAQWWVESGKWNMSSIRRRALSSRPADVNAHHRLPATDYFPPPKKPQQASRGNIRCPAGKWRGRTSNATGWPGAGRPQHATPQSDWTRRGGRKIWLPAPRTPAADTNQKTLSAAAATLAFPAGSPVARGERNKREAKTDLGRPSLDHRRLLQRTLPVQCAMAGNTSSSCCRRCKSGLVVVRRPLVRTDNGQPAQPPRRNPATPCPGPALLSAPLFGGGRQHTDYSRPVQTRAREKKGSRPDQPSAAAGRQGWQAGPAFGLGLFARPYRGQQRPQTQPKPRPRQTLPRSRLATPPQQLASPSPLPSSLRRLATSKPCSD
jgi:hypothetical protein